MTEIPDEHEEHEYYYYEIKGKFYILINGESAPPNTYVIPTHDPYVHLAIERKDSNDEKQERSGSWNRADTETGADFAAFPRQGITPKVH